MMIDVLRQISFALTQKCLSLFVSPRLDLLSILRPSARERVTCKTFMKICIGVGMAFSITVIEGSLTPGDNCWTIFPDLTRPAAFSRDYWRTEECQSWEDNCYENVRYGYLDFQARNCEDPLRYNDAYQSYCFMICLDMGDESYEECDRAWDRFYWCKDEF